MRRSFLRTPRSPEKFTEMIPLDATRKLDSLGRIVIPKPLREQFHLTEGQPYQFFLHEQNGHRYLCIQCPGPNPEELSRARKLLEDSGFFVTAEDEL